MVIDLADLRSRVIREVDRYGWVWAVNTFAYTPVVRMPNGVLIVVDPYLVLRRGFGAPLLQEKMIKRLFYRQPPDASYLRSAMRAARDVADLLH